MYFLLSSDLNRKQEMFIEFLKNYSTARVFAGRLFIKHWITSNPSPNTARISSSEGTLERYR